MKNNRALLFFFSILIVFGLSLSSVKKTYVNSEENRYDKKRIHYIDGVYKDPDVKTVEIKPYKRLNESEVPTHVLEDVKGLSEGVYHKEGILVVIPPKGTSYAIMSVQPTKHEVKVTVMEGKGISAPQYGKLEMSESFPIGVYNDQGEYLF